MGHEPGRHQVQFLISAIGKKKKKGEGTEQLIRNNKNLQVMLTRCVLVSMGKIRICHGVKVNT